MLFQIVLLCLLVSAWAGSISSDEPTELVIGGRDATLGEFSYQVSLQVGWPKLRHYCGGSLVRQQWVLTAAHCINGAAFTVKAGKRDFRITESTEQTSTVQQIFKHELYTGPVGPYDLALLKLSRPFQLNYYVNTIALPAPNSEPVGYAVLSGWGSTSRTNQPIMPSMLQTATLPLLNANACWYSFRQTDPKMAKYLRKTHICTGAGAASLSACHGDSGGPLIYNNPRGVKEIIGIVSWGGVPCGSKGAPTVYTKVSSYVDWIRTKMASY